VRKFFNLVLVALFLMGSLVGCCVFKGGRSCALKEGKSCSKKADWKQIECRCPSKEKDCLGDCGCPCPNCDIK